MPYLADPPSITVTPNTALQHLLNRLRVRLIEAELLSDDQVIAIFSDAYQRACERALCLQAIATVALTDATEYDLPDDHYRTLAVYLEGVPLDLLPQRISLRTGLIGYYDAGSGRIGLQPGPSDGQTLYILYARTPSAFATVDDVIEAGFPPEFYDGLLHYARGRSYAYSGGADRVPQARWERAQHDRMIGQLRRTLVRTDSATDARFGTPLVSTRPRFANDIDSR